MGYVSYVKLVIIRIVRLGNISMQDQYGREIEYLRVSVTDQCNLRCQYCMPQEEGCKKKEELLTAEEIVRAVDAAAALGIRKVRITGGEPLVRKDLLSICQQISERKEIQELCLTTNATLLEESAQALRKAGVQRVNISMDTLKEDRYEKITGKKIQNNAMRGLQAALQAGFQKVKINTVLLGGWNEDEVEAIARMTQSAPVDVRFIEWMPMYEGKCLEHTTWISCEKVLEALPEAVFVGQEGVARLYQLPGAKGKIGLISPISHQFCSTCNRLRLTADGTLKPCLHSAQEISIKGLEKEAMIQKFREAILAKPLQHPELSKEQISQAGRNMNQIGG